MNFPFPLGLSKQEWLLNIYIYLFPPGFQHTFIKIVVLLTQKRKFLLIYLECHKTEQQNNERGNFLYKLPQLFKPAILVYIYFDQEGNK